MKYWLKSKSENETVLEYTSKCNMYLSLFKQLLYNNIKLDKLNSRKTLITQQDNIDCIDNNKFNIINVVNIYIQNMRCAYDNRTNKCYYYVPNTIKCPGTKTTLNTVMRTLEYGTLNMSPLFWIRPSFSHFIEITNNK